MYFLFPISHIIAATPVNILYYNVNKVLSAKRAASHTHCLIMEIRTNEQPSKLEKLRSVNLYLLRLSERNRHFSKWLDDTTVHGIVHVLKEKSIIKRVIWGLIFFAAASYCLYNIGERASHFASKPSSTTLSVSAQDSVPFPAVTICNLNPIKKSVAEQLNITDLLKLYYQSNTFFYTRPQLIYSLVFKNLSANELCNSYLNEIDNSTQSMTLHDLYVNGAINSSELIQQCIFGQEYTICNDMFEPIITNLGLCYSINSNKSLLHSRAPGIRAGLNMLIDIQQFTHYIASLDSTAGVKVLVHSKDVLPDPDESGIAISPGKSTYISLNEEIINDETGNGCGKANERLKYFPDYSNSVSSCRAEIYTESIIRKCNCVDPFVTASTDIRLCTIGDLCCIRDAISNINVTSCLPTCQRTAYSTSVSYAQFPDNTVIEEFQQFFNLTPVQITSDVLSVNIYFEDLTITRITTKSSYSFSAFLSDIGGQLGLFIGASVISMLQIGILLFDVFKDLLLKCCKKTKSLEVVDVEMGEHDSVNHYTNNSTKY